MKVKYNLDVQWRPSGLAEDDDGFHYMRLVERDYARVPTIGENVELADNFLGGIIETVEWDNDGTVHFGFTFAEKDGLDPDFPRELEEAGFYLAGPTATPPLRALS